MAEHFEIRPDDSALALKLASKALRVANGLSTARPGSLYIPNDDGTGTLIGPAAGTDSTGGANGVAPWVGDTTPPGKPAGVSVTSSWGIVNCVWDGTLEGGVPADFAYVGISIDGALAGNLTEAGSVTVDGFSDEQQITVKFVAYDSARDRQGNLTPNASEPAIVSHTVDNAKERIDADVEQAKQDAADAKDKVQTASDKADAASEAAKAASDKADAFEGQITDITTTVNGVVQDVGELSTQVSGASQNAMEAISQVAAVSQDLSGFKTTVAQTYATSDDLYSAIADEVLNRNSAIEQSEEAITQTVAQTYLTKDDAETVYASKAQLETTAESITQTVEANYTEFQNFSSEVNDFTTTVTGDIADLQDQIDGNIATWFYEGVPTLSNAPANEWTDESTKNFHLGDLYYDTDTGYAYRFMVSGSTYSWSRITDSDVTKALADAANAQDIADSKRRVFVSQPAPPYDVGDLWVQGANGDILRCATARASGSYNASDWVLASKYTDDSALEIFEGQVADIYSTKAELETATDSITATVEENFEKSVLVKEADGGIVDCGDTAGMPLAGLTVYGQTRQNLWVNPTGTSKGITITANNDGSVTVNGTATGTVSIHGTSYILRPGTTYTVSVDKIVQTGAQQGGCFFIDAHNTDRVLKTVYVGYGTTDEVSFTVPAGTTFARFGFYCTSGSTVSGTYRVMLNEGSEAQPWCPPGLNSVEDVYVGIGSVANVFDLDNRYEPVATPTDPLELGVEYSVSFFVERGSVYYNEFLFTGSPPIYGVGYHKINLTTKIDASSGTANLFKAAYVGGAKISWCVYRKSFDGESSVALDLLGNKVSSLPDGTRDELVADAGGNVVLKKNTASIVTSTSNGVNGTPYDEGRNNWRCNIVHGSMMTPGTTDYSNGYCDKFDVCPSAQNGTISILASAASNGQTSVYVPKKISSTASAAKTLVEGQRPFELVYTPNAVKTIPLGTIDLPDLPEQNAHVWISTSTQGLDPDIHATWYAENASALKNFASKAELKVESDQIKATVEATYSTKEEVSAVEDKADAAKDALDSYKNTVSTTYATKSEVTQTASSIKSEVSETYTTKEEFNALEVGGRNLLLESDTPNRGYSPTSYPAASYPIVENSLVQGEKYTWSVNGTFTDAATIAVYFSGGMVGTPFQPIPGDGTHTISYTFIASANMVANDVRVDIYVRDSRNTPAFNGTAVIHWAKLEKGTKPTDWSPAPEDMLSVSDAETTYATKTTVSTVEQTVDSLTSTVQSNYTTLNNKFGNYYTKTQVDQKDSSIKTTVSEVQTTANNALSKASTVEQTAEGLEVRLTQAEKDVDTAQSTANNAAKTATNYLKFDSSGLCVGDMTSGTLGYNTLIKSTGLHIRNGTEDLASFEVGTIDLGGIPIEDAGTQGVLNSKINFAGGSLDSKVYNTSGGRMETQLRLYESRGLSDLLLTADTATLGGPGVTLRADTGQILLSPVIGGVYKKSTSYEIFAGRRLYYNASGTTGNITLSESAANFKFLDILFANNDGYRDSVRVYFPNDKSVILSNSVYKNEYTTTYVRNKVVTISGTSISVVSNRNGEAHVRQDNSCYATDSTSVIKIYAVWGWK